MISRPGEPGLGGAYASGRLEVSDPGGVRPAARRRRRGAPTPAHATLGTLKAIVSTFGTSRDALASDIRGLADEAELRQVWEIGHHVFGDVEVPWEVFLSLWHRYPDGITVMYLARQIAGVFEAWPVTRRAFQELIDGKIREQGDHRARFYPRHGTWSCSTWYASNIYLAPQYRRTDYTSTPGPNVRRGSRPAGYEPSVRSPHRSQATRYCHASITTGVERGQLDHLAPSDPASPGLRQPLATPRAHARAALDDRVWLAPHPARRRRARASAPACGVDPPPGSPSAPAMAAPTSSPASSPAAGTAPTPLPARGSSRPAARSPPRGPPALPADARSPRPAGPAAPAVPRDSADPAPRGPSHPQVNRTPPHTATPTADGCRCAVS